MAHVVARVNFSAVPTCSYHGILFILGELGDNFKNQCYHNINYMEEFQKTEFRNYLTAAGLLLIAFQLGILVLNGVSSSVFSLFGVSLTPMTVVGIVILIIGILLAIVGKRDLAAISFLLTGASSLCFLFGAQSTSASIIFAALQILFALVILSSVDRQKFVFFVYNLLLGLTIIFKTAGINAIVGQILVLVTILISLYFALAAGFEKLHIPGHVLMTEDQKTSFKESGSAIGYAIFATIAGSWAVAYVFGAIGNLPMYASVAGVLPGLEGLLGFILVGIGILLFAIGKMRFTPVMFMAMGTAAIVVSFSSGLMIYAVGGFFVVLGFFAILRGESRILPGIMLIVYGCTDFFSVMVGGTTNPILSVILNGIPCIIALYLAFATMSQKRLPLI